VRLLPGEIGGETRAPKRITAGLPAHVTTSGAVLLPPRTRDQPVTVAVFAYDQTGNISEPTVARLR